MDVIGITIDVSIVASECKHAAAMSPARSSEHGIDDSPNSGRGDAQIVTKYAPAVA